MSVTLSALAPSPKRPSRAQRVQQLQLALQQQLEVVLKLHSLEHKAPIPHLASRELLPAPLHPSPPFFLVLQPLLRTKSLPFRLSRPV